MGKARGDSLLFGLPGSFPGARLPDVPPQLLQVLSPGMVVAKQETGMSALQDHISRVGSARQHGAQERLRGFFPAGGGVSAGQQAGLPGPRPPRSQTQCRAAAQPPGPARDLRTGALW